MISTAFNAKPAQTNHYSHVMTANPAPTNGNERKPGPKSPTVTGHTVWLKDPPESEWARVQRMRREADPLTMGGAVRGLTPLEAAHAAFK